MTLPIWVFVLSLVVAYFMGIGVHKAKTDATIEEIEKDVRDLSAKVIGYRIILTQIEKYQRNGKKIPAFTEKDAIDFAGMAHKNATTPFNS